MKKTQFSNKQKYPFHSRMIIYVISLVVTNHYRLISSDIVVELLIHHDMILITLYVRNFTITSHMIIIEKNCQETVFMKNIYVHE